MVPALCAASTGEKLVVALAIKLFGSKVRIFISQRFGFISDLMQSYSSSNGKCKKQRVGILLKLVKFVSVTILDKKVETELQHSHLRIQGMKTLTKWVPSFPSDITSCISYNCSLTISNGLNNLFIAACTFSAHKFM